MKNIIFVSLLFVLLLTQVCIACNNPSPSTPNIVEVQTNQTFQNTNDTSELKISKESNLTTKKEGLIHESNEPTNKGVEGNNSNVDLIENDRKIIVKEEIDNKSVLEEKNKKEIPPSVSNKKALKNQMKQFLEKNKEKLVEAEVQKEKLVDDNIEDKPIEIETKLEKPKTPKPKSIEKLSHELLNSILQTYVSDQGVVNYAGLKKNASTLEEYIKLLENNPIADEWSRNEKLAYWINAYNAFTLKLIIDHYPLKSIIDLEGGKPWDKQWIQLNGKSLSLNNIENDIIRPDFQEPRIHFAVNCAAKSCPPLLNQAWTAENMETNLAKQSRKFINNANYNSIKKSSIEISKIFEWYAEDFGDLPKFLNQFLEVSIESTVSINYKEYDWSLNGL